MQVLENAQVSYAQKNQNIHKINEDNSRMYQFSMEIPSTKVSNSTRK